jgi:hypothetical protein
VVVTVVVVVVLLISAGLLVFASMSRETQAYKDGFSVGGNVYASDSSAQEGAQQACRSTELLSPSNGGRPAGDNASQWLKGCVEAFNTAQGGV